MITKAESIDLAETMNNLILSGNDPMAVEYMMNVSNRAYNRKPFITAIRLLGLGSSDAQENNVVVTFKGLGVPHILQPCNQDSFRLIGQAFVDVIMKGEFMAKNPKSEAFKVI
jgi:hypothetical protein